MIFTHRGINLRRGKILEKGRKTPKTGVVSLQPPQTCLVAAFGRKPTFEKMKVRRAAGRHHTKTTLANFPQRGYPKDMNWKLLAVTLVALLGSHLAFCGEIHDAAKAGDLEKVKALLKENPDLVNSKDDKAGETPLHFATVKGHKEVAELLLADGAEVDAKEIDGETPLHLAAEMGHRDLVELLLTNKANINATNRDGYTPLHAAALAGHKDVVELLLAKNANVNVKNNDGNTPLHLAAFNGFTDVAELLVANKADINARNNNGQPPLDEAGRTRQTNTMEWLRQHGGHE